MIRVFFSSLVFCWPIVVVICDHFYGGTMTWKPVAACAAGAPVSIIITQTYTWSYSLMPCTTSMISSNQLIANYSGLATKNLQCINNCANGSLGYSNFSVIPYCIGSSSALNTSIGQRSDIVTLTTGDDFSLAYQDGPWRILATSPNANWSLTSRINVKPRSDNGLYNSAPLSNVMSPIYIPTTASIEFDIPFIDADGVVVRCRWASSSIGVDECGGVCPPSSLPPGTAISSSCTVVMTAPNVTGWYAISVMLEDFINSTSTIPLSSIPVQFLVQIVSPPSCSSLPEVVASPSLESCTAVSVGQTFAFQLLAISYCGANVSIVDIPIQAFPGVIEGDVYALNSTTYCKSIYWTPTATEIGYQMMCAMAVDSQNAQSTQYCFNFYVSTSVLYSCPTNLCPITTTMTTTTTSKTTSTTSTSVSVTSTTSVTQSTTTSITSTTPTTDSISSSEPAESNLYKWLIIGSIVGIPLLLALIVASCLCWYYYSPCGIGRIQLSDCQGPFEFYHFDLGTKSRLNNIDTIEDTEKEQRFDDKYTNSIFQSKSSFTPRRDKRFRERRPTQAKPKRVTVISLPPSASQSILVQPYTISEYRLMNQTPDYERSIDNVHVRHFRWPQRWIRNEHRLSQFDSID